MARLTVTDHAVVVARAAMIAASQRKPAALALFDDADALCAVLAKYLPQALGTGYDVADLLERATSLLEKANGSQPLQAPAA